MERTVGRPRILNDIERKEHKSFFNRRYHVNNKTHKNSVEKQRVIGLREWVFNIKASFKCGGTGCTENDASCLDFHHRDPFTKRFAISKAVNQGYSKDSILAEMTKCKILCANCHRKEHKIIGYLSNIVPQDITS